MTGAIGNCPVCGLLLSPVGFPESQCGRCGLVWDCSNGELLGGFALWELSPYGLQEIGYSTESGDRL